ncbi:MAG TPA: hypothetical protein VN420_05635 [Candidatus Fimivivens sp.]|nr:hypothetical protein [Candidatus Fimivivens sp.]
MSYSETAGRRLLSALESVGISEEELGSVEGLAGPIGQIIRGVAEITRIKPVIDCDADPSNPLKDSVVVLHDKDGQLKWDPDEVVLCHFTEPGEDVVGIDDINNLFLNIRNQSGRGFTYRPYNANVLDFLMANKRFIPESLKTEDMIYFPGTVYCSLCRDLAFPQLHFFIRCMYWQNIENDWKETSRALINGCLHSSSACVVRKVKEEYRPPTYGLP